MSTGGAGRNAPVKTYPKGEICPCPPGGIPHRGPAAPPLLRDAGPRGFPIIPGGLGAIEYLAGRELAILTGRPRLFAPLSAPPGTREMRAVFPVEAPSQVAGVIRARRRRPASSAARLLAVGQATYSATSRRRTQQRALRAATARLRGTSSGTLASAMVDGRPVSP
jgi:hypothetical protein